MGATTPAAPFLHAIRLRPLRVDLGEDSDYTSELPALREIARIEHSQFVVATHSPILLGYPEAAILELNDDGIRRVAYEETEQVELTRSFLDDPQRFLRHRLREED